MQQKRSDQMGSVSLKIGDGTARFRRSTLCSSLVHLVMLTSVLITNLFALYAFTYSPPPTTKNHHHHIIDEENILISQQISSILREIELSERKLHQMERDLAGFSNIDPTSPKLPLELRSFLARHPLPLGKDSRSGMTELVSSVSHSCVRSPDLLNQFMSYTPHSPCPSSDLPSKLLSLGCDPIPRRRCLTRSNSTSVAHPSSYYSWFTKPRGKNDFSPGSVAALLPPGTGRIAFDVHAPAADFASAMAAHNVTVVTSSPSGVANGEGLLGLVMSPGQRFPFYDNVFDLVHTVKGLDQGGTGEATEFLMFDIDRVLRPGGLFWLDNLYCADDERKRSVTRLIEKFGYKRLKWVIGERASGAGTPQVYLSAVLQKPVRG